MPEAEFFSRPRFCSQCGQPIVVEGARFCKECGAPLEATGIIRRDIGLRPVIAFVLSLVPGLGHVYQGHPWRGIAWFFGIMTAYAASPPLGFLLQLICAANAAIYGTIHGDALTRPGRKRRTAGVSATLRD